MTIFEKFYSQKNPHLRVLRYGAPGEIRTPDRSVRSRVLYPAELQALNGKSLWQRGRDYSGLPALHPSGAVLCTFKIAYLHGWSVCSRNEWNISCPGNFVEPSYRVLIPQLLNSGSN